MYCEHFGYDEGDFIPSEISGAEAENIHHIHHGRGRRKHDIENLIALTFEEHQRAHFLRKPYLYPEDLEKIHEQFISSNPTCC